MEEEEQRELDKIMELLNDEEQSWGAAKEMKRNSIARAESRKIGKVVKSNATKREQKLEKLGARSKKFKHEVLGEDWGIEKPEPAQETYSTFEPPPTVPQPLAALEQGAEMEIEGSTASSTEEGDPKTNTWEEQNQPVLDQTEKLAPTNPCTTTRLVRSTNESHRG